MQSGRYTLSYLRGRIITKSHIVCIRFHELHQKYGVLDPLVEINLRPEKEVTVTVKCEERSTLKVINVDWNLLQLRKVLAPWAEKPAKGLRIFHEDKEGWVGASEMKFSQRTLLRYGVKTGDCLVIDLP